MVQLVDWSSEFLVSKDNPGNQINPHAGSTVDLGFMFSWTDASGPNSKIITSAESPLRDGSFRQTFFNATNDLFVTDMVRLPNDKVVVMGISGDDGPSGSDPLGRGFVNAVVFDPFVDGSSSQAFGSTPTHRLPSAAVLANGDMVFANSTNFSGNDDVWRLGFSQTLSAVAGFEQVSPVLPNNQGLARVVDLADGGYLLFWVDGLNTGLSDNQLGVQRYSSAHVKVGAPTRVDILGGATNKVDAVRLQDDRISVVYTRTASTTEAVNGSEDIWFRIVNPDLSGGTSEVRVNTKTIGSQLNPSVAPLHNGGFIVVWEDRASGAGDLSGSSVRAQLYDASGAKDGEEFLVNEITNNDQSRPSVSALDDGRFIIAWQDGSFSADHNTGSAIRAKIFDPREGIVNGTVADEPLLGSPAPDTVTALAGADTVWAMEGDDRVFGGDGDDRVFGDSGNDTLFGQAGADALFGQAGNDTLDGGSNPEIGDPGAQGDILLGGEGDDTYFVDSGLDLVDEGIYFAGFGFGGTDTIVSTADFYWDIASVGEIVQVSEAVNDIGGDGVTIVGGVFDNTLVGHSGVDVIFGRGGSDVYRGGDGIDWYSLSTLGLTDENAYAGVNGVNTVVVEQRTSGAFSYDIVFEFETGKDKFDLRDYTIANSLTDGDDVLARTFNDGLGNCFTILGDGLDFLYIVGIVKENLSAEDFLV